MMCPDEVLWERTLHPAFGRDEPIMNRLPTITVLSLFALFVAAKIHGSSIGCWDMRTIVPDTNSEYSYPHVGKARYIRSDEWCISTPQVLAQCASPDFFPRVNKRVSGGTDMFVSTPCNPVWDGTVPGQFHNWGYFLFGAERGLAWNWWCRYLGLPFFAYLAFLAWLGRDRLLAATAALAVTLGAPTQWWDTTIPYTLLYFFAALVFVRIVFLPGSRIAAKTAAAAGFAISLCSYAFAGYPIWGILLVPPFAALAWETARDAARCETCEEKRPPIRPVWFIFGAFAFVAAEIVYCAHVHGEAFGIVAGSVYPGGRFCRGGPFPQFLRHLGLDVVSLFFPFASFQPNLPAYASPNCCEAARYFVPGTAIFALLLLKRRFSLRLGLAGGVLFAWGAVLLVWSGVAFPAWVAKTTGFHVVLPRRAEVIAGFIFLLLAFRMFASAKAPPSRSWMSGAAVALVSTVFVLSAVLVPEDARPFFATRQGLLFLTAGVLLSAAVSFGLAARNRWLFCGGYLALSLVGGLTVHPLAIGISPLVDKGLSSLVRDVDARQPGRWMSNNWRTGSFLLAQGLDCHPGTQPYANPDFWAIVDPDQKHVRVWNRYAHCNIELEQGDAPYIQFVPSVLRFTLNERQLRGLGVTHLVWKGKKLHEPWLRYEGCSGRHFVYTLLPEGETEKAEISSRREKAHER
jgi:hypothetical protein